MGANDEWAIYGSILVAALVATLDAEHASARDMVVAVLSTMLVFWVAHVWAGVVGTRLEEGPRPSRGVVVRIARRQWPMIESALLPALPLALAWIGVLSLEAGADIALGVAIAQLVAWGMVVGLRTQRTWPRAVVSGLFNGALGLVVVALKTLVH
jgi:hypothetical protein